MVGRSVVICRRTGSVFRVGAVIVLCVASLLLAAQRCCVVRWVSDVLISNLR